MCVSLAKKNRKKKIMQNKIQIVYTGYALNTKMQTCTLSYIYEKCGGKNARGGKRGRGVLKKSQYSQDRRNNCGISFTLYPQTVYKHSFSDLQYMMRSQFAESAWLNHKTWLLFFFCRAFLSTVTPIVLIGHKVFTFLCVRKSVEDHTLIRPAVIQV